MSEPLSPDSKVAFRISREDGGVDVETLWAESLGDDQYALDNSPFYAYCVSWRDTVYAPIDEAEGRAVFAHVVEKSGNRTVRIMFDRPVEDGSVSDAHLKALVGRGCSYEGASSRLISLNIPPETELQSVRSYLIEHDLVWEHADPTYEELFPDDT